MLVGTKLLRKLLLSCLWLVLLAGCATVDDPRKADIFTFSRNRSQEFIEERQADLDVLRQQRAQLDLEKERLRRENEQLAKERDVLLAQLLELDRDTDRLKSQVASLKADSVKLQVRRRELQARIKSLKLEVMECQKQTQETPEKAVLQKRLDALRRKQRQLEQEYAILSGGRP